MGPEGGPGPEVAPQEIEEENISVPTEKRRGLFSRFFRKNEESKTSESLEILQNPEKLVDLMAETDSFAWRERKIQERYGEGRIGKFKAFVAGERDFSRDEDGRIRWHGWNELSRKALKTVFNRKTAVAAGTLAVVGVLTGGVGVPAAGALFGSMVGQGVVEAWHSYNSKEQNLRAKRAFSEYGQWESLHGLAQEVEEAQNEEEKGQRIGQLVEAFRLSSEDINTQGKEIIQEEKIWNKRRQIGSLLGGLAGAGIGAGLSNLGEKIMTMDIDGNGIKHLVERVNDSWHYVYNNQSKVSEYLIRAAEMKQHLSVVPDSSHQLTHVLGKSTWEVVLGAAKNVAPIVAQVGAVFASLWVGRVSEQKAETQAEEVLVDEENGLEDRPVEVGLGSESEVRQGQIDVEEAFPPAPSQEVNSWWHSPEEARETEVEREDTAVQEAPKESTQQENRQSLPSPGQNWVYGTSRGFILMKIRYVDSDNGKAIVDQSEPHTDVYKRETVALEEILQKGLEQSEFIKKYPEEAHKLRLV